MAKVPQPLLDLYLGLTYSSLYVLIRYLTYFIIKLAGLAVSVVRAKQELVMVDFSKVSFNLLMLITSLFREIFLVAAVTGCYC